MYKVKKVLNNNALLIVNPLNHQEIILTGNGIGFRHQKDDDVSDIKDCKKYFMDRPDQDAANAIAPIYMEIASLILTEAENAFDTVNRTIAFSLADHIAFAIERIESNIVISNPFTKDISILFGDEYSIALKGKEIIKEKIGVEINDDEVSYITLHIHNAITSDSVSDSMKTTLIINSALEKIEELNDLTIDKNSLSYSRLLIHLKYMFARLHKGERLNIDMDEYVSKAFTKSYAAAKHVCEYIKANCEFMIPFTEIGYLAIHIERIRQDTKVYNKK